MDTIKANIRGTEFSYDVVKDAIQQLWYTLKERTHKTGHVMDVIPPFNETEYREFYLNTVRVLFCLTLLKHVPPECAFSQCQKTITVYTALRHEHQKFFWNIDFDINKYLTRKRLLFNASVKRIQSKHAAVWQVQAGFSLSFGSTYIVRPSDPDEATFKKLGLKTDHVVIDATKLDLSPHFTPDNCLMYLSDPCISGHAREVLLDYSSQRANNSSK